MNKILTLILWVVGIGAVISAIVLAVWAINAFSLVGIKTTEEEKEVEVKLEDGEILLSTDGGNTYDVGGDNMNLPEESEIVYLGLSPDKNHVCFLVETFAPKWLYYAKVENGGLTGVLQVDLAENCVWSPDSEMIAFNNHTTDVSPHNVFVFYVDSKEHSNFTSEFNTEEIMRMYELPSWSADSLTIESDFIEYDENLVVLQEGSSRINIETGEVVDE